LPFADVPVAQTVASFEAGAHPTIINGSESDQKAKFIASLIEFYHSLYR
jgi:hypothetical protein